VRCEEFSFSLHSNIDKNVSVKLFITIGKVKVKVKVSSLIIC
jgi:hypothetical protein